MKQKMVYSKQEPLKFLGYWFQAWSGVLISVKFIKKNIHSKIQNTSIVEEEYN